ncbi:hypothetical protein ACJJIP_11280 [Microbulbifer sp. VTAC004]|uniref:hypothetical protein n=1 Tax=Microbulbifer sp. VTAC004 TaxID=3243386 RepID=UPI00403A2BFC
MKYIYLTFNWSFGVLFLLFGLVSLAESLLGGICLIIISLLLLPISRKMAYSKTNKKIPTAARVTAIFVLFFAFGALIGPVQEKKEQELAAQREEKAARDHQEKMLHFNKKREEILAKANSALSEKNYQTAATLTDKHLYSGDKEISEINKTAKNKIAEIQKIEKTKTLLAKLKSVPASETEENIQLYQQLAKLHPNNEKYKAKITHYNNQLEKIEKEKIAAEARNKLIKRQFSPWDGSHNNLERFIKKAMNDPDSYKHDKTVYWDKGDHLIVKTTYRGKNAFGGVVRNFIEAKIGLDGTILEILDHT